MAASGRLLGPGVTHTFLTHTTEQKSPFFILRCMRSFCATEHNPFFIILTGFKGMWLFLCDFSNVLCTHAALQLRITSILRDFTPTFRARLTHRSILLRPLTREVLEESSLFPFCTTSSSCFFPTLLYWYLPAVSASSGNFYRDIKPQMQKDEGTFPSFLPSAASILEWNKAVVRPASNQTPLGCVNAVLGAGLCPTAASYLGLTSYSKL